MIQCVKIKIKHMFVFELSRVFVILGLMWTKAMRQYI